MRTETRRMGKNRGDRTGRSLPLLLLSILTVIGVITFIVGIMVLRDEMHSSSYSLFEKGRITYTVEDKEYGRIIDAYYEYNPIMAGGQKLDQDAVALAEYIDASMQKEIFSASAQTDLAGRQEKRAEDAGARTGIYQGEMKVIDQRLQKIRDKN